MVLGPFLARSIQKNDDGGENIAPQDAVFGVSNKISAAKRSFEEEHVQFDGLRHGFGSIETKQFVFRSRDGFHTQSFDSFSW